MIFTAAILILKIVSSFNIDIIIDTFVSVGKMTSPLPVMLCSTA